MEEQLQDIWTLAQNAWTREILGIELGRIVIALAIILGFLILRQVFTRLVIWRLQRWADRSDTRLDQATVRALAPPIRFVPLLIGLFVAVAYLGIEGRLATIADDILRSLVVFTLFWLLYAVIGRFSFLFGRLEHLLTGPMVDWLVRALRVGVVFIGAAIILELWGIQVGPLLAGLGLFGVAVALGAQDLFKNLIAGILVIAEKRFQPGDWIHVDGVVEGTVETIGFRSTLVRRFDLAPVYVPNAKLSDNSVTNFSGMTYRRIFWMIGVEYRTTVAQLREIRDGIEKYILENDDFVPPERASTFVRIDKFNDSSIDIMLYCFTRTTAWGEWLAIKEKLAYHIKDTVEAAETGFAFPSQSLYVEALPDDRPETFVPPGNGDRDRGEAPSDRDSHPPRQGRREAANVNDEAGPDADGE
ncbi:mechanosensitive ion channel family protein [Pelagibius sp. 7325]|uniref:mechanosensitive ion channel family protein n=1 Tax=Pelagibius sp. 7325 TaxID=3131994 RepID=UPI0030ECDA26